VACRLPPVAGERPGPVVLVVDDEPAIRLLCRVNLELDGYVVEEAATLEDARSTLAGGGIGLVLLDMHVGMEQSDELLAELAGTMPVAAVTGSADLGTSRFAGADEVLAKPFTLVELRAVVGRLAGR
jgi:DNA-binding response OmpR family regulator